MRYLDVSSWQGLFSTVFALALITLVGVGIRLLVMQTVQQRRQRENRQINERLRTLIAAYKTLGGSFTGDLEVDPTHLREIRRRQAGAAAEEAVGDDAPREKVRARGRGWRTCAYFSGWLWRPTQALEPSGGRVASSGAAPLSVTLGSGQGWPTL